MGQTLSNLNQLVHIKIKDKVMTTRYTYHPARKKFWIFVEERPAIFTAIGYSDCTEQELNDCGFVVDENKSVWVKPKVFLYFSNSGNPIEYSFDTYEEAGKFVHNVTMKCNTGKVNLVNIDEI